MNFVNLDKAYFAFEFVLHFLRDDVGLKLSTREFSVEAMAGHRTLKFPPLTVNCREKDF